MPFAGVGGTSVRDSQYLIDNSLRFNDDDSPRLDRTNVASPTNSKKYTYSVWIKRSAFGSNRQILSAINGNNRTQILYRSGSNEALKVLSTNDAWVTFKYNIETSAKFRDCSAWYHVVCAFDSTNATANDRFKIYVNGVEQSLSITNSVASNYDDPINSGSVAQDLGHADGGEIFDGYFAEAHFIDGQALSPTDFGEFDEDSGIWKPIEYTGTYGTNGFYLDFENSGSLGADQSGNGNNFTPTNLASTDQTTDTPTNNFATLNPLNITNSNQYLSEGNLDHQFVSGNWLYTLATMASSSGKWYAEVKLADVTNFAVGFCELGGTGSSTQYMNTNNSLLGVTSDAWSILNNYTWIAKKTNNSNTQLTSSGTQFANNDICMLAIDIDNQGIWFGRNGTWFEGDPSAGTGASFTNLTAGKSYTFASCVEGSRNIWNFGSPPYSISSGNTDDNGYGNFEYAPPTGFLALCTQNLATVLSPTIDDGSQYFNTVLYTGDGTTNRTISGVGFQPDWTWLKRRSSVYSHGLLDSNRGVGKVLSSDNTDPENTNNNVLSSWNSDGFVIALSGVSAFSNTTGETYVGWNWKANGGTTSSNTDGSITSTVQANTTAGFSIITYTGTGASGSVGHGLTKAPEMVICKQRTDAGTQWQTGHTGLTNWTYKLLLNATTAESVNANVFPSAPTSTVINLGLAGDSNGSGKSQLIYAFHSVEGYSKFGKYTGNGSTDGTFVYTGFRPAFVIWKRTDSTQDWFMQDIARNTYNVVGKYLRADTSDAEGDFSTSGVDFISNGFKMRTTGTGFNASGGTYIYMAFAENPFVSSTGIPVVAR